MNLTRVIPPEGVVECYELIKPHTGRVRFFYYLRFVSFTNGESMTQIESARKSIITPEMAIVASDEQINPEVLRDLISNGEVVIPANHHHKNIKCTGLGSVLRVKVNANVGTSPRNDSVAMEIEKARTAQSAGADAIMDLSIAGNISETRRRIINATPLPFGSVPLYEIMAQCLGDYKKVSAETMISVIKAQAADGVDFMTVHCGITREALPMTDKRQMGIVSRGGSFIAKWMKYHNKENPLYEHFDALCTIAREYDVTLSLGDALRPGSLADAGDEAQYSEIDVLGSLVSRARNNGVQVIVEGPGHVPMHMIREQVLYMREKCLNAPLYLLGPLVTDRAAGHDHIAAAIGGAIAAEAGTSFLCYVTPAEHLRLPDLADVREGVIAARIAGHAGDIAKNTAGTRELNRVFSDCRHNFDWNGMFEHAIDPEKARAYRHSSTHEKSDVCSMCGEFCSMKGPIEVNS